MAIVTVKVSDRATPYINRITKAIPVEGNKMAWRVAQKGALLMKRSALIAGIRPSSGRLFGKGGIRPVKIREGHYGISIPREGVMLDNMPPHWVSLKRGRRITEVWAKKANFKSWHVFVHPHPFIENGWRQTVQSVDGEVGKMLYNIMR